MLPPLLITRTGYRHSYFPRRFPERLRSAAGVAPSLGSPPVSDGLSAQTKWRLVVSTPLIRGEGWRYSNIRREGEEGGRVEGKKRGEVVFVGVRDCPETGSVLFRQSPISICRGQWSSTFISYSQVSSNQWWEVTDCNHPSTVQKCVFEAFVLFFNIYAADTLTSLHLVEILCLYIR